MMNILLTNHDIYTWKDIFQIFIVMSFNNKILQLIALIQLPYVIKVIKHLVFVEIVEKFNCFDLYDVLSKTYFILPKVIAKWEIKYMFVNVLIFGYLQFSYKNYDYWLLTYLWQRFRYNMGPLCLFPVLQMSRLPFRVDYNFCNKYCAVLSFGCI